MCWTSEILTFVMSDATAMMVIKIVIFVFMILFFIGFLMSTWPILLGALFIYIAVQLMEHLGAFGSIVAVVFIVIGALFLYVAFFGGG